ncbi:MAG: hypothetical protein ACE5G8_06990 [Anaerolineae bacterium]
MNDQYFLWDWLQKGVFVILMAYLPTWWWISYRLQVLIEDEQEERVPSLLATYARIMAARRGKPLKRKTNKIGFVVVSLFFPVLALCSDIPEPYSVRFLVIFLAAVLAGLTIALFEWLVRPRKIYELDEWDED